MADGGLASDRVRLFLRRLKPAERETLVTELERNLALGNDLPDAPLILEELRSNAHSSGQKLPRIGNPSRLFFVPIEPFLVDDVPERKHRGRISRACLTPLWQWICRDLLPEEAEIYNGEANKLLAANDRGGAEQLARAFQDLTAQRMREVLNDTKGDEKRRQRLAAQVSTPQALQDVREIQAILQMRDALAAVASRLPLTIGNLANVQLDNAKMLLDSSIVGDDGVFLYALLVVMSRLGAPWQLIRLAILAAGSDVAEKIAKTPFSVAVDVVLTDIERMIATLRTALRAHRSTQIVELLKGIHDSMRALSTELILSGSPWARQLAMARAEVAKVVQAEIEPIPGRVRLLLRPRARAGRELAPDFVLDAIDVAETEATLEVLAVCRSCAGELAISEATRRVHSELQNYFDSGTQVLLDRLRMSPPQERTFRQSQADAAVRFCAQLFGADYAGTLAKAVKVAARGEQTTAKA